MEPDAILARIGEAVTLDYAGDRGRARAGLAAPPLHAGALYDGHAGLRARSCCGIGARWKPSRRWQARRPKTGFLRCI